MFIRLSYLTLGLQWLAKDLTLIKCLLSDSINNLLLFLSGKILFWGEFKLIQFIELKGSCDLSCISFLQNLPPFHFLAPHWPFDLLLYIFLAFFFFFRCHLTGFKIPFYWFSTVSDSVWQIRNAYTINVFNISMPSICQALGTELWMLWWHYRLHFISFMVLSKQKINPEGRTSQAEF